MALCVCRRQHLRQPRSWCCQRCGTAHTPMTASQRTRRTLTLAAASPRQRCSRRRRSMELCWWAAPYPSAARGSCSTRAASLTRMGRCWPSTGEDMLRWMQPCRCTPACAVRAIDRLCCALAGRWRSPPGEPVKVASCAPVLQTACHARAQSGAVTSTRRQGVRQGGA